MRVNMSPISLDKKRSEQPKQKPEKTPINSIAIANNRQGRRFNSSIKRLFVIEAELQSSVRPTKPQADPSKQISSASSSCASTSSQQQQQPTRCSQDDIDNLIRVRSQAPARTIQSIIMLLNIILLFTYMPTWLTLARAQQPASLSSLASALSGPNMAAAQQQQQHLDALAAQISAVTQQHQHAANQRQQLATGASGGGGNLAASSSTTATPSSSSSALSDLSTSASNLLTNQYLNSLTSRSFHHPNHNYASGGPQLTGAATSTSPTYASLYPSLTSAASTPVSSSSSSAANSTPSQYASNHQYPTGSGLGGSGASSSTSGGQSTPSSATTAAIAAQTAALANLLYGSGLSLGLGAAGGQNPLLASPSLYGGYGSSGLGSGGLGSPLARQASYSPYSSLSSPLSAYYSKYGGASTSPGYLAALQTYSSPFFSSPQADSTDYSALLRSSAYSSPAGNPYAGLYRAYGGQSAGGTSALDSSATSPYSSLYSGLSSPGAGSYGSYLSGGSSPYSAASLYSSLYGSGASSPYASLYSDSGYGSSSPYSSYGTSGSSSLYGASSGASSLYGSSGSPYSSASSLYSSYGSPGGAAGYGSGTGSSPYSSLYSAPSTLSSLYSSLYAPYLSGGGGAGGALGGGSGGYSAGGGTPRISIAPLFGSGSQSYYSYMNPYSSSYGSGASGGLKSSLMGGSSLLGGKLGLGLGLAGLSLLG